MTIGLSRWRRGRSPGSCGSFWMCRARSRLTGLCRAENRSPRISHLSSWTGKWSDDVRIVFSGNKAKEYVAAAPANSSANHIPLTEADRIGAVDPMTALLVHIGGNGATAVPEACKRTVAIFDGHTRYNLRLAFERLDTVKTDQGYQGPAVVCSVKFFPIAGYDPNHFLVTYLAAQHDTEIWLAPLAGSRLVVPYRASISTPMGLGILQATKFEFAPSQLAQH